MRKRRVCPDEVGTCPLNPHFPPEPEKTAEEMRRLLDENCPGLIDETRGAADSLGIPFEKALFCAALGPTHPGCSQMAILPGATQTGHLYVARSYEIGLSEADLRLCTMRMQGKAAHLSFSEMLVGRNDGINSHGLCVTMSGSWDPIPQDASEPHGLHYPYVVRSLLDHCVTLDDALALLERAPISSSVNMILADRSGAAALVEIAGRQRAVKRIGASTDKQFVFATNHSTMLASRDTAKTALSTWHGSPDSRTSNTPRKSASKSASWACLTIRAMRSRLSRQAALAHHVKRFARSLLSGMLSPPREGGN
jgi:predicted choloylglycine hydrolase